MTSQVSRHIIENFEHIPGHHCGSTALRDLSHFYGHELSEAMCFGLGSGLGFFYVNGDKWALDTSPSRLFGGRTADLEVDFFRNMGAPFEWREADEFPWPAMREYVEHDVPVLLMCDLKYLDYYNTSTHFSGHVVVLAGYDDRDALLADTHFEGLQRAAVDELAEAMVSNHFPFAVNNRWGQAEPFELPDLKAAGRRAIARTVRNMLEPAMTCGGVAGLRMLADDLVDWEGAEDLSWAARFGYQVIGRRGTGGGNFRRLYAGFLAEIASHIPEVANIKAAERTEAIAGQWTTLAGVLKEISETEDVALLETAADLVDGIADQEESLFRDLNQCIR